MCGGVVIHDQPAPAFIYLNMELSFQLRGKPFRQMNDQLALLFRVDYGDLFVGRFDETGVPHLATAFSIERSFVQHELEKFSVLLLDLSVFDDLRRGDKMLIADKLGFCILSHNDPVTGFFRGIHFGSGFLLFHFRLEAFLIDRQPALPGDQGSKVQRKTERVI